MLSFIFFCFAAVLITFATLVICLNNPVYAVLSLIICFISGASLLVLIGADYLAMIMIIVYVGAVAVLFLFTVMIMNIKIEVIKGKAALLMVFLSLAVSIPVMAWIINNSTGKYIVAEENPQISTAHNLGKALYSSYAFHLQTAGIILLVAMVGAIMLVMYKGSEKSTRKTQSIQSQNSRSSAIELVQAASKKGVNIN